jgi:hypothetical protein
LNEKVLTQKLITRYKGLDQTDIFNKGALAILNCHKEKLSTDWDLASCVLDTSFNGDFVKFSAEIDRLEGNSGPDSEGTSDDPENDDECWLSEIAP